VFLFILSNGWRDLSRPRADEIKVLREEKGNWEQKSNGAMESSRAQAVIFNSNQPLKPKRDERIALIILNVGALWAFLCSKRKHERTKRRTREQCGAALHVGNARSISNLTF
jgi:hypothetical protein